MSKSNTIVQLADLATIKRHYNKAVKANATEFTCKLKNGVQAEFLTSYAKYLIEYLTSQKHGT